MERTHPIYVLVDLSNFAYENTRSKKGRKNAQYGRILAFKRHFEALKEMYKEIITIFLVDASLYHKIDAKDQLAKDFHEKNIHECPAGIAADDFLLEFLNKNPDETIIVSNDRFQDHDQPTSTLPRWRFPAMIIEGQVIIPNLVNFLEHTIQGRYAGIAAPATTMDT